MVKYRIKEIVSPNPKLKRLSIIRDGNEILNFDYHIDYSGEFQIYFNTIYAKVPSNNCFPVRWTTYSLDKNINFFTPTDHRQGSISHISIHPVDLINNLGRRTHIYFEKSEEPFVVIGQDKLAEFVPLINFFKEIDSSCLEHITILQNFQSEIREKTHKTIFNSVLEEDEFRQINEIPELKKASMALSLGDEHQIVDFFINIGKSQQWIDKYKKSYEMVKPKQVLETFDFNENYALRISANYDIKMIEDQRKFFDINTLNLILIGNMGFAAETEIAEGKKIAIGHYS